MTSSRAHVILVPIPEQKAGVIDAPSFELRGVTGLGQFRRVGAGRGLVVFRWWVLLERLVRPNFVVLLAPFIETSLLRSEVQSVFAHCLVFERSMHPLVTAILVGTSRLNALGTDAKANPPHRQVREAADG